MNKRKERITTFPEGHQHISVLQNLIARDLEELQMLRKTWKEVNQLTKKPATRGRWMA